VHQLSLSHPERPTASGDDEGIHAGTRHRLQQRRHSLRSNLDGGHARRQASFAGRK
jgi:hypothetical protein